LVEATLQDSPPRRRKKPGETVRDYVESTHRLVVIPAGWLVGLRIARRVSAAKNGDAHLNPALKAHMHPLPADLSQRHGTAPSGYLYGVIGGNVVMLDRRIKSMTCSALTVRADSSKDALGQSQT